MRHDHAFYGLPSSSLQAGQFWLLLDPSWTRAAPPLQRLFMPDGTTQPGTREDPFWGELLAVAVGCLFVWSPAGRPDRLGGWRAQQAVRLGATWVPSA